MSIRDKFLKIEEGGTNLDYPRESLLEPTDFSSFKHLTKLDCGTWKTCRNFDYYDSTGGVDISSGLTTILFDSIRSNCDTFSFSASSGVITSNVSGRFWVGFDVTTQISSGTNRSTSYAQLEINTGSGFTLVPGTYGGMYNRTNGADINSASRRARLDLNPGDEVRVRAARLAGSSTIVTAANGSSLWITPTYSAQSPEDMMRAHGIDCGTSTDENILGKHDCGEE
jgi:hypothetical protein